jgi:hypothetical protein
MTTHTTTKHQRLTALGPRPTAHGPRPTAHARLTTYSTYGTHAQRPRYDDPKAKFTMLNNLTNNFQRTNGRFPTFWLDKVCKVQVLSCMGRETILLPPP